MPTLKIEIIVVVAIIDIAVGPGGGFRGPGGGFSKNRSSGKPLLLQKLKKPPPGPPKPPPGPTAMSIIATTTIIPTFRALAPIRFLF